MKHVRSSVLLRFLLSVGVIFFVLSSILVWIDNPGPFVNFLLVFSFLIQFLLGITVLILRGEKKAYEFFIALVFIGYSILSTSVIFVFSSDIRTCWPVYMIASGVFIVISGFRKYKKIKFGYIIPSLSLFCLGIVFSLFSFDFIKLPFRTVVVTFGPIVVAVLCGSLVLFFLIQQHHKELIIVDDDSGDFDDEELSFPKLD